jgi:glycosyltransferase involved in cell wall biosynthesis
LRFFFTRRLIKKTTQRYIHSQVDIFLTFSFSSAGFTSRPIIQFGDWTYDHLIRNFKHRLPDTLEKRVIHREDLQIRQADLVFVLFPAVAEYMQRYYGKDKIVYLGNVINALAVSSEKNIPQKQAVMNLLFVGNKNYKSGADTLIAAFQQLKSSLPTLTLHIIGMNANEWNNLPEDVFCYGYLDKGIDKERELYYKLYREATLFVNTTPQWSAFSASIEAMYFYTPIVVSPSNEFVKTFGDPIHFGYYCEENSVALLKQNILNILHHKAYPELCRKAHEAVRAFTWDAYMDKMIEKIEALLAE